MASRRRLCYENSSFVMPTAGAIADRAAEEVLMVRIEFTPEEAENLREILDNYLSDLRMEIVDTDSHDYREMLKKRKDFVARTIGQLVEQLKLASS
jgi:hypothetical protein